MRRARGFTLIEILVVIGIIVTMAAMLVPAINGVRQKTERSAAMSNMRQIGTSILMYANDQDGLLPGPLQLGQKSSYSTNTKQLACVLAPYLNIPEPVSGQTLKVFSPPAFARAMKGNSPGSVHPFMMNISPRVGGTNITPFGSDNPKNPSEPMKVAAVGTNVWIMCDADQGDPEVSRQPWAQNTPKTVIHGKRLALYLDGAVGNRPESETNSSKPPPPPPPPPPRP